MVLPVVISVSILESVGGIELLLVDAVQVPNHFASATAEGNILVGTEKDNAVIKKLTQETPNTSVGTSLSMHDQSTNTDYQTPASGTTKIILIVTASSVATDLEFKVWDHTVADTTPGGTPEYDFSNTTQLDANEKQTTLKMTGFGTSKFVNVELEAAGAGGIFKVEGWAVEIP